MSIQAVVYEGLRIHPPFSGLLMKLVPPEGYEYSDGRKIPGGTFIGQNAWAAMRDRSVFGDDAEMFRPDRFLEVDAATRGKMRSTVDLVFGYGRWQCMGRPISMMELHKVFVEVGIPPFIVRFRDIVLMFVLAALAQF
jgi:cytochrome P450